MQACEDRKPANQRLGFGGLVATALVFNTLTAFSLDVYAPALPGMAEYFSSSTQVVTLSITGYLLFSAVGMLVFGTLSDKYGRKPLLMAGAFTFAAASACCALAPSVAVLIAARCVQALGSSCSASVATAVVRDCFEGKTRENVYVVVQMSHTVSPLLAPVVGAFVLTQFSWRATFWVLFAVGVAAVVLACLFQETAPKTTLQRNLSLAGQVGRIGYVLRNRGIAFGLVVMSFFIASFNIYVTVASYIYIDFFGLSAQQFSFFFAAAGGLAAFGPLTYTLFLSRFTKRRLTTGLFVAVFLSLFALMAWGQCSPWHYFLSIIPHYYAIVIIKPYFTNLLLSQEGDDTGVVASLVMFSPNLVGCVAAQCVASMGSNFVVGYITVSLACILVAAAAWARLNVGKVELAGLDG